MTASSKIGVANNGHHQTSNGTFKPANFAPLMNGTTGTAVLKPAPVQQMLTSSNTTVTSQQSTKQSTHKSRQSTEGEYQVFYY
jgi:hypothetical protein